MKKVRARIKTKREWPEDLNACGTCLRQLTSRERVGVMVVSGMDNGWTGYMPLCILDLDEGCFSYDR